jgi:ATP-dependent DNA helicase RecQ
MSTTKRKTGAAKRDTGKAKKASETRTSQKSASAQSARASRSEPADKKRPRKAEPAPAPPKRSAAAAAAVKKPAKRAATAAPVKEPAPAPAKVKEGKVAKEPAAKAVVAVAKATEAPAVPAVKAVEIAVAKVIGAAEAPTTAKAARPAKRGAAVDASRASRPAVAPAEMPAQLALDIAAATTNGPRGKVELGLDRLLEIGQSMLGIPAFRPGQAEAFEQILAGKDVLAVMPTGAGKSLLYQLPSLILPGLTVVVSPLIALIKDQIDKMVSKGVAVVRIDSTLTVRQRREMDALALAPGGKLLLTTPERMADPEFRVFLREAAGKVGVSRFVVDEAHCVSQWGHDFRPAYLSLRKALEDVGRPPVLATTATAPPHVRDDILHQLGMEDAKVVTTTFDRPNLHYEVINFSDEDEKMKTLVTLLRKLPRPGIVYCATVKKVEDLHEALARWNIPVAKYHGRLTKTERDAEQERFMASKDVVMVATNAFGLGVDKRDIRNVLHYHMPGSLEAYAQEAGRGGRDGKPSRCVMLFSPDDVAIQEYFLSGTYPTRRQVRSVWEALQAFGEPNNGNGGEQPAPTIANIAIAAGVGSQRTRTVLNLLKDEHFVTEGDGATFRIAEPPPEDIEITEKARQYEARRIADRQRLDALLAYVKAPGCRNQVILQYLGETEPPRCHRCDNCLRSKEAALEAATLAARLGQSVTRLLDEEGVAASKPRRILRHRVVRIDQPAEGAAAAPAPAPTPVSKVVPPVVRRRAAEPAPPAAPTRPATPPGPTVLRRSPDGARPGAPNSAPPRPGAPSFARDGGRDGGRPAPLARPHDDVRATPPVRPAPPARPDDDEDDRDDEALTTVAATAAAGDARPAAEAVPGAPEPEGPEEEDDDLDDEDDDDLEGEDEDDDDDDLDDDEDDDEDDLDDEDDDDEDDDDEDDDDEDDDEDDADEYEVIDRTAAELAEEGVQTDGEITILARKKQPKPPRTRPAVAGEKPKATDAEARRRRRRRRRKRRGLLPPKSAFSTPVLSSASSHPSDAQPAIRGNGARPAAGGPVIEYVRGPMRINSSPVASATPNDAAAGRRKKRRTREFRPTQGDAVMVATRPLNAAERRAERAAERLERKKRRRRRRKRKDGAAMGFQAGAPGANGAPGTPVSATGPNGAPVARPPSGGQGGPPGGQGGNGAQVAPLLGPDGQPLPRKRRRRRRRGRGGRAPRNADGTWKVPPGEAGASSPGGPEGVSSAPPSGGNGPSGDGEP